MAGPRFVQPPAGNRLRESNPCLKAAERGAQRARVGGFAASKIAANLQCADEVSDVAALRRVNRPWILAYEQREIVFCPLLGIVIGTESIDLERAHVVSGAFVRFPHTTEPVGPSAFDAAKVVVDINRPPCVSCAQWAASTNTTSWLGHRCMALFQARLNARAASLPEIDVTSGGTSSALAGKSEFSGCTEASE